MDNTIFWVIIIAFYAPLHYMLPVVILFVTGNESEHMRKALMRRALIDSTVSMLVAFVAAIVLVNMDLIIWAMLVLLLSMPIPFLNILAHRRDITGGS